MSTPIPTSVNSADDILQRSTILIADDEMANILLLEGILDRAGYQNVHSTNDSRQVLPLFNAIKPDLILLDLHMPHLDGFAVLQQLTARIPSGVFLPVLVLTADTSSNVRRRALAGGAKDFLTKPLDNTEVLLRIHNLLEAGFLYGQLHSQNRLLEERVHEKTAELEESRLEILERLSLAAEYRDDDTGAHTQRVGITSAMLAETLRLADSEVQCIRRAAPLHDIGKIGIPDAILLKPGKLTPPEFEIMKTHTTIGAKMLSGSQSQFLQRAEEIALFHHERWDGNGYSPGLHGDLIPLNGRIVAVADVFDALTHDRPYKQAWNLEDAIAEIRSQRGKQFDPEIVDAFLRLPHSTLL
jgi:putative two-component system response regulator